MFRLSHPPLAVFALCAIALGSACSKSSEQAGDQSAAEVAAHTPKIVYYAIPG